MASDKNDFSDVISRRRFVELTGVTGAAALAGCGGGGEETTEPGGGDGDGGSEPEYPDQTHVGVTTINPSDVQFNPFNSESYSEIARYLLFEDFATYDFIDGEFTSAAVDEWNFTGDSFEMTLRDDLTWSDGEDVTADDVYRQLKLAEYDEDPMWNWASGVEATSDTEVVIDVGEDVNPELVYIDVLDRELMTDPSTYQSYLDDLESGDVEISELRGFADSDPVTNGPFQLDQKDDQTMLTTHFPDSPHAGNVNFGEYEFQFISENPDRQAALANDNIDSDYSVAGPENVTSDYPDHVENVQIPDVWGLGLAPNHDHVHAGDRAVRQAIQHVIDRQTCVQNSHPSYKIYPQIPTGVPTEYQESYLGDEIDQYEDYGPESQNTDEATQVLQDAGYERVDGTWQDSDGNDVVLPITHPGGWGDWTLALETAQDHLESFGFDVPLESTGSYTEDLSSSDDWVIIANTWLHGGPSPYPYFALSHQLHQPAIQQAYNNYPGYTDQFGGSEADITVPARDGDGEMTLNPAEQLDTLSTTTDEDEATQIIRDLAWVSNQDLPRIVIKEKRLQQWLTSDEWDLPDDLANDHDANAEWACTNLPRHGKMNYSG